MSIIDPHAAAIRRMAASDCSVRETAAWFGLNESSLRSWAQRNYVSFTRPRCRQHGRPGEVPVAVLQEAVARSGMTYSEIANRLGWTRQQRGHTISDPTRVKRRLGLASQTKKGYPRPAKAVRYETAVKFAAALDLDPVDLGV